MPTVRLRSPLLYAVQPGRKRSDGGERGIGRKPPAIAGPIRLPLPRRSPALPPPANYPSNSRTGCRLRTQMPLALPLPTSEPEPDLAVATLDAPANSAVLPAPRSSSRSPNRPSAAKPSIRDFRLVNLPERCLEAYRHAVPDPRSFSARRCRDCRILRAGRQISPLTAPETVVPVAASSSAWRPSDDAARIRPAPASIPLTPKRRYSGAAPTGFACQSFAAERSTPWMRSTIVPPT